MGGITACCSHGHAIASMTATSVLNAWHQLGSSLHQPTYLCNGGRQYGLPSLANLSQVGEGPHSSTGLHILVAVPVRNGTDEPRSRCTRPVILRPRRPHLRQVLEYLWRGERRQWVEDSRRVFLFRESKSRSEACTLWRHSRLVGARQVAIPVATSRQINTMGSNNVLCGTG